MKLVSWLVGFVLLVSSCAATENAEISEPTSAIESESEDSSNLTIPAQCDVDNDRAMSATIGAQIDALRAGNFSEAYSWAAPAFQQNVTEEMFERVIREGYSSLLESRSHTLSDCVLFPRDLGNTVVTVTTVSGEVYTYYYELIKTAEGWRILGAAEIAPVSSGA
jgi:hypothetical protein